MDLTTDFSVFPAGRQAAEITRLCDAMEAADAAGRYPQLTVERPWSVHNPVLEGEFAAPRAIRWYLERELGRLAADGARISVRPGREALDLHDPELGRAVDETRRDLRRKKLFLFAPERMALSIDRLRHYTGTEPGSFQRYVLLTNYAWHVEEFRAALPDCTGPDQDGRQMPAWHYARPGRAGGTMINIGGGPRGGRRHGIRDRRGERVPLPDPGRHPARGQRQAPARGPEAQRRRSGLLRRQPPPARRDRHLRRRKGQETVSRRPAHGRPPLPRRTAARHRHPPADSVTTRPIN